MENVLTASVTDLDTSLTNVDGDDFTHLFEEQTKNFGISLSMFYDLFDALSSHLHGVFERARKRSGKTTRKRWGRRVKKGKMALT